MIAETPEAEAAICERLAREEAEYRTGCLCERCGYRRSIERFATYPKRKDKE